MRHIPDIDLPDQTCRLRKRRMTSYTYCSPNGSVLRAATVGRKGNKRLAPKHPIGHRLHSQGTRRFAPETGPRGVSIFSPPRDVLGEGWT